MNSSGRKTFSLPVLDTVTINPDPEGIADAVSRIGYEVEEALADIIDNSVDARAKNVLVRFFHDDRSIRRVVIGDDGRGLDEKSIIEAMKFGVTKGHRLNELGRYGIGLKTASLNMAEQFSVISRKGKAVCGLRWSKKSISKDWLCERLRPEKCREVIDNDWGKLNLSRQGTLVFWDNLTEVGYTAGNVDKAITKLRKLASKHLGIVFHRFISKGKLKVWIDAEHSKDGTTGLAFEVEAFDPFKYPRSGTSGYPRVFQVQLKKDSFIRLEAHIWPPKSRHPNYVLGGGKVAARQGFYFYRNDRLIQAGGWNGWRENGEPHLSLARICVELSEEHDAVFRLPIQKSKVYPPKGFTSALDSVRDTKREKLFTDYITDAQLTYRARSRKNEKPVFIPDTGVSIPVREEIRKIVEDGEIGRPKKVRFAWSDLGEEQLFELDHRKRIIHLNLLYRQNILSGARATPVDAPVIKTLLCLLTASIFAKESFTGKDFEKLGLLNRILLPAVKAQG